MKERHCPKCNLTLDSNVCFFHGVVAPKIIERRGTCCINHDPCDPKFLGCNSATGYPMWQRGKRRANTKEKLPTAHNE